MILRLSNIATYFVVHIDVRVSIDDFSAIAGLNNVFLVTDRCNGNWGSYGPIQATLNAFDFIHEKIRNYDRVILLSGQDYPIKSASYIQSFFDQEPDLIYIDHFSLPTPNWEYGGKNRFPFFDEMKNIMPFYGGSAWWSFPHYVVQYILEVMAETDIYEKYFKLVTLPDESFFQTILLNSDEPLILEKISNTSLHYLDWSAGNKHPKTLSIDDFGNIKSSSSLYARKFDTAVDEAILNLIDDTLCFNK
jgi:hypothetical protein